MNMFIDHDHDRCGHYHGHEHAHEHDHDDHHDHGAFQERCSPTVTGRALLRASMWFDHTRARGNVSAIAKHAVKAIAIAEQCHPCDCYH